MRPTFLLNLEMQLVSALVSKHEPHSIKPGFLMQLTRPFNTPWGPVPAGTQGVVDYVDADDGIVYLLMLGALPVLFNWDNQLILVPFETEDLTECFVCVVQTVQSGLLTLA